MSRVVACACWLLGMAAAAPAAGQEVIDRVLARVGESVITRTDLESAIGFGLVDAKGAEPLQQLVDRRLVLREMQRRPPAPPGEALVDEELERLRRHAGDGLTALMAATGVDQDRLRRLARDNLRMAAFLRERFPLVPAGDADAEQYYRTHPEAFYRDGETAPFDAVIEDARRAAAEERRATRVRGWIETLRNRTDVRILRDGTPA